MHARFAQLFLFSSASGEPMGSALFTLFPRVVRVPVMSSAPFALLPRVIRAPVFGPSVFGDDHVFPC
jgi:hypothetical protein